VNNTFKSTLDLIPNGVLILNIKQNQIAYANKEMLSILGLGAEAGFAKVQREVEKFLLD